MSPGGGLGWFNKLWKNTYHFKCMIKSKCKYDF